MTYKDTLRRIQGFQGNPHEDRCLARSIAALLKADGRELRFRHDVASGSAHSQLSKFAHVDLAQGRRINAQAYFRDFDLSISGDRGSPRVATGVRDFHGVRTVYFTNSPSAVDRQFLLWMDLLKQGELRHLASHQAGAALHIERAGEADRTFWMIDQSRIAEIDFTDVAPPAYRNMPSDFREYFLRQYRNRLTGQKSGYQLSEGDLSRLKRISEQVSDRSVLYVSTKENPRNEELLFDGALNHFTIEGGALAVRSSSPDELLPMELLHQGTEREFRIPRKPGESIVEIGRFTVSRDSIRETSPRVIQQLSAATYGLVSVSRIVIEADVAHTRMFSKLGFRVIHTYRNRAGSVENVLEIRPQDLFQNVLEKEFADEAAKLSRASRSGRSAEQIKTLRDAAHDMHYERRLRQGSALTYPRSSPVDGKPVRYKEQD